MIWAVGDCWPTISTGANRFMIVVWFQSLNVDGFMLKNICNVFERGYFCIDENYTVIGLLYLQNDAPESNFSAYKHTKPYSALHLGSQPSFGSKLPSSHSSASSFHCPSPHTPDE